MGQEKNECIHEIGEYRRVVFEHACAMMNGKTQVVNSSNNNINRDGSSNSHRRAKHNGIAMNSFVFP